MRLNPSEMYTLEVTVERETPHAIMFLRESDGEEVWLQDSVYDIVSIRERRYTIKIPGWLVKRQHLEDMIDV